MLKIYVEKKRFTKNNGEVVEYNEYYIYVENEYNIPKLKVYINLESEVLQLLQSVGAIYEEKKEDK